MKHRLRTLITSPRPAFSIPRNALLAAVFVLLLIVTTGSNPYSAYASTFQLHGAMQRDDGLGVVAHRGVAGHAPENTLASMRIAYENNLDFVEADLQLTSDGVAVLMHDETLDRTTNGTGTVGSHTLEQIKSLDAGSWFGPEFAGEPVPTLEEFLDELTPSSTSALIEFKGEWGDEDILAAVELLRDRYLVNRVIIESFETPILERLQALAPEFARMMLTKSWDEEAVQTAVQLQVSVIGARSEKFEGRTELIAAARERGIGTMVYTLNEESEWRHARELGIDLVITDVPLELGVWSEENGF